MSRRQPAARLPPSVNKAPINEEDEEEREEEEDKFEREKREKEKGDKEREKEKEDKGKEKESRRRSHDDGHNKDRRKRWGDSGDVHKREPRGSVHGDARATRRRSERGGRRADGEGMGAVKQATLLTYHLAIEDSVDIDKVWHNLEHVFDDEEQEEIQTQGTKKAEMKKVLDLLANKDDEAFDTLISALRPDYKWLASRLQQGVRDEERRVNKLGKGIKRKIALALLTARISERQKDGILDRVTSVVETEMAQKANRVNIPDHRAAAQLDNEHQVLQDLIRNEVDPLLFGEPTSSRSYEDHEDTLDLLRTKLEDLKVIRHCYNAFNFSKSPLPNLPGLLVEKIDEVNTKIHILQQEKQAATAESERLSREKQDQQRSLSRLQQRNRNLQLENGTLESDRKWLDNLLHRAEEAKRELEKDYQRTEEENRDLRSEIQQVHDKLSGLALRNKSLDLHNTKLTRDNQKLSASNTTLRREARNKGDVDALMVVRSENKRLTSDRTHIKKELQRTESEKRQLVIRSQKLESENRNLKEQKRQLLMDKKRNQVENKALKTEAKRLSLGKFSTLPPITEDRTSQKEHDDASDTSRSRSVTPESRRPLRRTIEPRSRNHSTSRSRSTSRGRRGSESPSPWNKYREDNKSTLPKGRGSAGQRRKKEEEEEEVDEEGKKKPSYMKSTSSSRRHSYFEEEGRSDSSPTRPAARR